MAYQHFYSRVPARVSMYNRADGFDTFAQSAELKREFVERELAPVYENKLNKNDVTTIRLGQMPRIFTQCCTRSGSLVQNCITYLPLDYTGERSAYLSHSLIYTEEEKLKILSSREENTLHSGLFTTDIASFSITSPTAVPDDQYPEMPYFPGAVAEEHILTKEIKADTAHAFLYAILNSICGKGRNVFFKLSGENDTLSEKSVQLFNEVLAILPRQLRKELSFVSFVTDAAMYPNHKLKGVSAEFQDSAAAKFVYFDLQTGFLSGVQLDEVVANKPTILFLYSLLDNKALRQEFLSFMDRATEAIPSLQNLNLKVLGNLVFLFRCSCGLYDEQEVLPNDTAVYDYLCAYEKYRAAMTEEYRMQAYRCLLRYPRNHMAIPKNIFAKASRLYGAESRAAKRIFMNIVLELIHTDIMRDKLFTFIKSNYPGEETDMKNIIIDDLCRVFYGGFLQNQLLAFFSEVFPEEPEETRTMILEKLLLSIRTPGVQGKILSFLDQHYELLSQEQKDRFYQTFLEMLPECDKLAATLMEMVDRKLENEPQERKEQLTEQMIRLLENDSRRKERKLMPLMAECPGFSRELVIRQVFGPWQAWKVHSDYIDHLRTKTAQEKTEAIVQAFRLVKGADVEATLKEVIELYQPDLEKGDLFQWLDISKQLQATPEAFCEGVHEAIIEPAVTERLCDAFQTEWRSDGMALVEGFAAEHPRIQESWQYRLIHSYTQSVAAAKAQNFAALDAQLPTLLEENENAAQMAEYLRTCEKADTAEGQLALEILQNLLQDGAADLGKLYRRKAESMAAEDALQLMLAVCVPMSQAGAQLEAALTSPRAGLQPMVAAFVTGFGKGAYHRLKAETPQGTPFGVKLEEAAHQHKKANGSFLTKLFGKK